MKALKYTKIKTQEQYDKYCEELRDLLLSDNNSEIVNNHIELLTILIDQWDMEQYEGKDFDPVELIISLKKDHNLSQKKLANICGVSTSYMSEMLNYKKHLSKNVIRKLSNYFKISQEALNRPYSLNTDNSDANELLIENLFLESSKKPTVHEKNNRFSHPVTVKASIFSKMSKYAEC